VTGRTAMVRIFGHPGGSRVWLGCTAAAAAIRPSHIVPWNRSSPTAFCANRAEYALELAAELAGELTNLSVLSRPGSENCGHRALDDEIIPLPHRHPPSSVQSGGRGVLEPSLRLKRRSRLNSASPFPCDACRRPSDGASGRDRP
jgi:hypothetical protein